MTIHPLADAIAKAILATVERDRCCNLENIQEAVFRELAVEGARPRESSRLREAARRMLYEIDRYSLLDRFSGIDAGYGELRNALQETGRP